MRLAALTAGLFLGLTGLATAQTFDTPQALLEAFYAPYFSGEFTEDESPFFSDELEALYAADAEATPEGEIGALDFDPFVDGQDFELTDFEIGAPGIAGDYASADVTFNNMGRPTTLAYEFVKENGSWQIDDVVSTNPDNPYRLSDILGGTPE